MVFSIKRTDNTHMILNKRMHKQKTTWLFTDLVVANNFAPKVLKNIYIYIHMAFISIYPSLWPQDVKKSSLGFIFEC